MSWGWGGQKNGEPLFLDDCETPESPADYQKIAEESIAEILRLENSNGWEEIAYPDERVHLAGLLLEDTPLKCVRTSVEVHGAPKVSQ